LTKERKVILIIGGLLLLAGAIYRFSPAIGAIFGDDASMAIKLQRIAKYRKRIAATREIQDRIVSLTRALGRSEQLFLDGSTPALAAVHIQNIINEIAHENALAIDSLTVNKPKPIDGMDGYLEIPVQVRIKPTIRQLHDLLLKLETAPQLLSINAMQLRHMPRGESDVILADLTITGYMKNPD
jgi:hypothetical protein